MDAEELAAFLDGMLPPAERKRVVRHLAACEDCYWVFRESLGFLACRGWGVKPLSEVLEQTEEAGLGNAVLAAHAPMPRLGRCRSLLS